LIGADGEFVGDRQHCVEDGGPLRRVFRLEYTATERFGPRTLISFGIVASVLGRTAAFMARHAALAD